MTCRYKVLVEQWLSSLGMEAATRVQILDLAVCISQRANNFKIGITPNILLSLMCRLGMTTSLGEGKLCILTMVKISGWGPLSDPHPRRILHIDVRSPLN